MLLTIIEKLYGEKIDVFSPCPLTIESFEGFSTLLSESFSKDKCEDLSIVKTDRLHQRNAYYEIWNYIQKHPIINDQIKAEDFLNNLNKSTVNIIINNSSDISDGIRYFIDVNLKGKQLDTEDIFKSYLFKNDSRQEIRDEWYRFKENTAKAEQCRMNYPLLKLLEHYFYCDLYKDPKYKGLEFGEDFLLKKEFKTREPKPQFFREGIHIIELIRNKAYMLNSLRNLNNAIEIMTEIVSSNSFTQTFKNYFLCTGKGKNAQFDPKELAIIHNITKKILKDAHILPKALVMKYILSINLGQGPHEKSHLQRIYGVYLLAVLFTIFENKKSKEVLLNVLKADDTNWYTELINQIQSYFSSERITDNRLLAQYKLAANEEEDDYRFRCKSLATIYNYFTITNGTVDIIKGKMNQLFTFITNDDSFSVEHFIISKAQSGKSILVIDGQPLEYEYDPKFYRKYLNSLFNFIFIPQELNSKLKNYWLPEKLDQIDLSELKCDYTRMYLEKVQELSSLMKGIPQDAARCKDDLDLYFSRDFKEQYIAFAKNILNTVIAKIKSEIN